LRDGVWYAYIPHNEPQHDFMAEMGDVCEFDFWMPVSDPGDER